ncbi:hypothetical protein A2356_01120 [Candidatus Nomurabacteria bacterium RIFOXYB1_FULL_39_16]|uniref:Uncharacterized protein n=2 Tax=Candidatus Nomuraibacteriota TaxID=1752729 RepID=A0A0G0R0Y2_9BACT|nr:MAG: hypothetical protein UT78_C0004G0001 [Candidatus Nomurabacteria bacterium GW2011_GWF2_40_12]OGJ09433.1 MAG: hypothetical protein A2356_01120 [Candidatus Nomurabacteria bacterium RIFOXYB1_FULL_39_16]OGJ14794.1 MAG: hypothetical protein A2585_03955 [Candidatus Nomurabacteria bacterium RIFOXYD1_FULL_39_12]
MKNKIVLVFLFSLLVPVSFSSAYIPLPSSTDLGGASNPINIQILPDLNSQKRQENLLRESQLKAQYGYSVYSSCKPSACGNYNAIDPFSESSCLSMLEAWLGGGRCLAQRQKSNENIQCVTGYTKVLSNGWYVCSPVVAPTAPIKTNDQVCIDKFGAHIKWDGTKDSEGLLNCGCESGYQANSDGSECVLVSNVPVKTNDQICQDNFGLKSNWDGTKNNAGGLSCGCQNGYQFNQGQTQCISIPKAETKTIAPVIKKVLEVKENTTINKPDPIDKVVVTNTEEVKPKSFWAKIKNWLGF